uniref:folate gamma-glutamyl hydrolase n=1 Tax=Zea mays TaxID=4577 RepID=A0A804QS44_MAIZE
MDSRCPHLLLLLPLLLLAALLPPPSSGVPEVIWLPTSGGAGPLSCAPPDPAVYDRPVIGIVSHPGDGAGGRISNTTATSYIGASYVKFVEAAGSRVIPLVYNEPEDRLLEKLSLLNGVLFTGGSEKEGVYFDTIKRVFQYVLDKNDAGEPFPLFAQCLGFELVSMIVSKDNNILEAFDAQDQASTLQFPSYALEGSVFQRQGTTRPHALQQSAVNLKNDWE